MKFTKLTKKLLLSALSLGLAVVTLTTTTFAWYTSSTDATATAGTGTTSGTTADSTLMISNNGNTWSQSTTITASTSELVPLQWNGTAFQVLNPQEGATTTTGYYSFQLYFRTTRTADSAAPEKIAVYINNILLANSNTALINEYDNLTSGSVANCPTEATYSVDVVRALDLVIADSEGANGIGYELSGQFSYEKEYESGFGKNNENIGSADALAYYNTVMGTGASEERPADDHLTDITVADKTTGNIAKGNYIKAGDITKGTGKYEDLVVTFIVYLNGWDAYCFDACKGQTFSVSLGFTTDNE